MNADRSVDGQVNVGNIPRSVPIAESKGMRETLITAVQQCWDAAIEGQDVSLDYFAQAGVDVKTVEAAASIDRRYRGLNRYVSWWYRLNNTAKMFEALRSIATRVQDKRGKPHRVWFRIHWNMLDKMPGSQSKPKGSRR